MQVNSFTRLQRNNRRTQAFHRGVPNAVWVIYALLLILPDRMVAQDSCPEKTAAYNGYSIVDVQLRDPIGFIVPWNPLDKRLKGELGLKKGGSFSASVYEQDSQHLSDILQAQFASSQLKVKFKYVGGVIADCTPAQPVNGSTGTLRVVYPFFVSVLPLPQPTYEEQRSEEERPGTTGAIRAEGQRPVIVPLAGNNATRGTFGGVNFSARTVWLDLAGQAQISGNSRSGYLTLGSPGAGYASANHPTVFAVSFVYDDVPVGRARYLESKIGLRASSSSKELGSSHSIFRYGAAIDGGHQDSSGAALGYVPVNSSFGSLKFYAGLTGRPGSSGFTASGGFELGDTFQTGSPLFKKYLLDIGLNHTFAVNRPKPLGDRDDFTHLGLTGDVHRSLFLDAHFTGGVIQAATGAPMAERFFGGNAVQHFIPDDSWSIPSGAFIRSIAENHLGARSNSELGGSRFYSGNLTVAFTAWGKPILPKELVFDSSSKPGTAGTPEDKDDGTRFPEILNIPFKTAAKSIANTKELDDPAYVDAMKDVTVTAGQLGQQITAVLTTLKKIPADLASQTALKTLIAAVHTNAMAASAGAKRVAAKPNGQVIAALTATTGPLPALSKAVDQLTKGLSGTAAANLIPQLQQQAGSINDLSRQIAQENNVPKDKYLDAAWKDLAPGHRALDVFLHDLNIYSISPVAMIDVARVWPVGEGVRYGIGPGLRVSLVNANFTFGYSFNPDRLQGESTGAIYMKLDVTSLF